MTLPVRWFTNEIYSFGPIIRIPRVEASISSTISELRHDDIEKELEEEKKLRQMAESQRDEALKGVEDLRQNLAKNRARLKVRLKESQLCLPFSR